MTKCVCCKLKEASGYFRKFHVCTGCYEGLIYFEKCPTKTPERYKRFIKNEKNL